MRDRQLHAASRRRAARAAAAVALVVSLGLASTPAHAGVDWYKVTAQVPSVYCQKGPDDPYKHVGAQVRLWERGRSGVTQMRAKYRVYRTNVSAGWNPPRLERTYWSVPFRNDDRTLGSYLPQGRGNLHHVQNLFATNAYRLDVKATWMRPYRPDWNHQWSLVHC